MSDWRQVPLRVTTDVGSGGRWTSLTAGGREWLWANPDPQVRQARNAVRPGDPFVDAGGGEECFPTVQGVPDHGDLWTRRWDPGTHGESVVAASTRLTRQIRQRAQGDVLVNYRISGPAGLRFVHAVHLLLDVSPEARVEIADGPPVTWRDADGTGRHVSGRWPTVRSTDFSLLGPDDGTAACLIVPGVHGCRIVDGPDALTFAWRRTRGAARGESLILWRNLGGWPSDHPYRSIGLEPCLGDTVDHDEPALCSATDGDGESAWELVIAAFRAQGQPE